MIELSNVSKTFTLHNQGSAVIEVISDVSFEVAPGECVALTGASGAGKSTLMRMIYGNYLTQAGEIRIGDVDIVRSEPRDVIKLRRDVLGYVSQFLRVVPRVPTVDVVAEPPARLGHTRRGSTGPRQGPFNQTEHPGTALVALPHNLLGGRATAGEYCPWFCPCLPCNVA